MKSIIDKYFGFFSEKKNQKSLFLIIIVLTFLAIYLLNLMYPIMGEDWDYSFFWDNEGNKIRRIDSFSDILVTQYHHYIIWGGRVLTHGLVQVLLFMGEQWHDVLNSVAFILFVYFVYKIVNNRNSISIQILLLVIFGLWLCLPDFASNTLWISYSGNYLWGSLIIVAFIYPLYSYYRKLSCKETPVKSILMFLAGVIAGWTNENISIALICFIVMLIFLLKYQKESIPKFLFFGLAGACIGCLILLLAPGNYLRLDESSLSSSSLGTWEVLGKRILRLFKNWFKYISALTAIYLVVLYVFTKKYSEKDKLRIKRISLIFFISAYIGLLVMTPLPEFSTRTLFGVITFLIIAIGILFSKIPDFSILYRKVCCAITFILFFVFCFVYSSQYKYIDYIHQLWHEREMYVTEQKNKGVEDIVFKDSIKKKRGFIIYEFGSSAEDWPNTIYAKYYDVNSVKIE